MPALLRTEQKTDFRTNRKKEDFKRSTFFEKLSDIEGFFDYDDDNVSVSYVDEFGEKIARNIEHRYIRNAGSYDADLRDLKKEIKTAEYIEKQAKRPKDNNTFFTIEKMDSFAGNDKNTNDIFARSWSVDNWDAVSVPAETRNDEVFKRVIFDENRAEREISIFNDEKAVFSQDVAMGFSSVRPDFTDNNEVRSFSGKSISDNFRGICFL